MVKLLHSDVDVKVYSAAGLKVMSLLASCCHLISSYLTSWRSHKTIKTHCFPTLWGHELFPSESGKMQFSQAEMTPWKPLGLSPNQPSSLQQRAFGGTRAKLLSENTWELEGSAPLRAKRKLRPCYEDTTMTLKRCRSDSVLEVSHSPQPRSFKVADQILGSL